jgi:uncharacterized protein (TIGR00251 family)
MSLYLKIKVNPNRPKTEWGDTLQDGTRKVKIAAPPEKGKANRELIRFLSEIYDVPTSRIKVVAGKSNAFKLIRIDDEKKSR